MLYIYNDIQLKHRR